ncbi:hypothetical protein CLV88_103251 [Shimia abyssi]|uniref:Uncharacterized protein n=1 Tax=Shimia abyssi TaxID=1662395 RepID=A0A2P8FFW0_9RHOB|nr:hypothetical protein CLV88_103251 [Shimia abyssi]
MGNAARTDGQRLENVGLVRECVGSHFTKIETVILEPGIV